MYYNGAATPFQQANKESAVMSPPSPSLGAVPLPRQASFCCYGAQTDLKLILSHQHCLVIGRADVDGRRNHDNESTIGQSGRSLVTKISPSTDTQWRGVAAAGRIGARCRPSGGGVLVCVASDDVD